MARNYGKKNSVRRNSSIFSQLMLVGVAFLLGYGTASVFDFAQVSTWFNTRLVAQAVSGTKVVAQAPLPKPKFEFYTLLANGAGATQTVPAPHETASAVVPPPAASIQQAPVVTASAARPSSVAPINLTVTQKLPAPFVSEIKVASQPAAVKGGYLVQVASFRNFREADHMKGSLAMKGFVVKIVNVSQQNVNWYRVIIGPFASRAQAQKAQVAFARTEHIMGMIRKMDA